LFFVVFNYSQNYTACAIGININLQFLNQGTFDIVFQDFKINPLQMYIRDEEEFCVPTLSDKLSEILERKEIENEKKKGKRMHSSIFRQYDIRGIVDKELNLDEVYDLTLAILEYYLSKNPDLDTIIVCMDGRTHSKIIKKEVIVAATDIGINVIDIGLCPTPVFYFATHTLSAKSGIMITASHNPSEYNGLKLCLDRKTVWGEQIQEIRKLYETKKWYVPLKNTRGSVSKYNCIESYISWMSIHFDHLKDSPLSALIDCGNGTAGAVIPKLIETMGWKNIEALYKKIDGTFPHHEPDPTVIDNMRDVATSLKKNNLDLGIGLDGDCDRMTPMTPKGILIPGDQLLALFAQPIIQSKQGATIIYDVKTSASLTKILDKWGARGQISACGHSIIKEAMSKHDAVLAGELSCHFFFKDRYFGYDDGIYAILRLMEILQETNKALDELIECLPPQVSSPEFRMSCAEKDKEIIVKHVKQAFVGQDDAQLITIDGVRVQLPYGWGLIRASNTQPAVSLRFEADTQERLQEIKKKFAHILHQYIDTNPLIKDEIDT
jgi:phosphomannomutase/phosphoglucomutase